MVELHAIKTRRLLPPQDNLAEAFNLTNLQPCNGDVLVISSKVIAIDEGRCVSKKGNNKSDLVHKEADIYLPKESNTYGFELAIIHHALLGSAGVDASNCGDYFTLLPQNPFASAHKWHKYLCEQFNLTDFGVIITDSHPLPMRWGVVDISIGFWGINPLKDYRGTKDLFGYKFKVSQGNHVDAIAAAAGGIMGQGTEQTPAVLVRGWPDLDFDAQTDYSPRFLINRNDDMFNVLLEVFNTKGVSKNDTSSS